VVSAGGPGGGEPGGGGGGLLGALNSGSVLASGGLDGNSALYSGLPAARDLCTSALDADVPSSCGSIWDKGGGVLCACGVAPFISHGSGFDAHDQRFGTLDDNLFGGGVLAAGAGAIHDGGFDGSDDGGGGSLDGRARSDPGSGGCGSFASGSLVKGVGGLGRCGPGGGTCNLGVLVGGYLASTGGCSDFSSGVHVGLVGAALGSRATSSASAAPVRAWSATAAVCLRIVAWTHRARVAEDAMCAQTPAVFWAALQLVGGLALARAAAADSGVLPRFVSVHRSNVDLGSGSGALGHGNGLRHGFLCAPGGVRFSGASHVTSREHVAAVLAMTTTYWVAS
jgi:hypothetical protein